MKENFITIQMDELNYSYKINDSDASIDEIVSGFVGLCLAHTFTSDQIYQSMQKYIDENNF